MVKSMLALPAFLFSVPAAYSQVMPAEKLLSALNIQAIKFDEWAAKKKFFLSGTNKLNDTLVKVYQFKPEVKKNKPVDSVKRSLFAKELKKDFSLVYQTESADEFLNLLTQLKQTGFYCNAQADPLQSSLLFQHKNLTVNTSSQTTDSATLYSLAFHEQDFPDPKDLFYADDLLNFTSHEYLTYFFGEENVKKDFYYFSGEELVSCSVLFINTSRQVVFIWKDENNKNNIDKLLFGGQQKLKSSIRSSNFVAESDWLLKSGIHAGMPLYELRVLNGDDIKFYGGNSPNSGLVVPEKAGKLDFKKEQIILGCVNCGDNRFPSADILNADDAIADGKILFVLSVVLDPDADNKSLVNPKHSIVTK